jgi:hypothetical protein
MARLNKLAPKEHLQQLHRKHKTDDASNTKPAAKKSRAQKKLQLNM